MHCTFGSKSRQVSRTQRIILVTMQKVGPPESIIRSRSRSPAPKRRPILQVYVRSRSRSPNPMTAFSKQKAVPSASHMSMPAKENEPTSSNNRAVTSTETAMRTGETREEVLREVLGGDNTIEIIRGPYSTGVPFSCIRCGHQSFLALCKESEMVWAVRCLHCYLIHPILPIHS